MGIAISQVVPIILFCYGLSDTLIAIEQPEILLYPKL
jgi:predicted ATPase